MHISKAALDNLNGAFEVEPGHGGDRDQFLYDSKIETFLIVGRAKQQSSNGKVSIMMEEKFESYEYCSG